MIQTILLVCLLASGFHPNQVSTLDTATFIAGEAPLDAVASVVVGSGAELVEGL
ncbi:MAG TPA: hypothetical protein VGL56_03430 [Fimbriimonadaceae bacterium]